MTSNKTIYCLLILNVPQLDGFILSSIYALRFISNFMSNALAWQDLKRTVLTYKTLHGAV